MTSEPLDGPTAARLWLQQHVDTRTAAAAQTLLRDTAEILSIASGDGVAIRVCSKDGQWLLPLAAHHPNPTIQTAMWDNMRHTAVSIAGGLWAEVVEARKTTAYDLRQPLPDNALPSQVEFLQTYPATHLLTTPVLLGEAIVGCVSLIRYVSQEPFSDNDRLLLEDVARRAASAIDFGRLAEIDLRDD